MLMLAAAAAAAAVSADRLAGLPGLTCFLLFDSVRKGTSDAGGGGVLSSNHSSSASCGRDGLVEGDPTHVVKEATSRRWDTHPRSHRQAPSGQGFVGLGEPWGLAPWFAGEGECGGESHLLPKSPSFLVDNVHLLTTYVLAITLK
jgi:hypothetical protein